MIVAQKIGANLVDEGRVSASRLRSLLAEAGQSARPAWQLVEAGLIEEQEWARRVADHFGLAAASLADFNLDRSLLAKVPEELARRRQLLPLCNAGGEVYVATSDPTGLDAFDHLAGVLGAPIQVLVVPPSELEAGLREHYLDEDVSNLEHLATEDLNLTSGELARLREEGASDRVIRLLDQLMARALSLGATDIHIEPSRDVLSVRFRVDGLLREGPSFPRALAPAIVSRVKVLAQLDISERWIPQDGRVRVRNRGAEVDMRISCIPVAHGEKVVIRLLPAQTAQRSLGELGFRGDVLALFRNEIARPDGMLLVTGPTGSGKSTTLYAALHERLDPTINVSTIEDPIEYEVRGINQIPVNRKRGITFPLALRALLRQDPDVILVGEIRDRETGVVAAEAAMTGHLLLATVHANSATQTIQRMVELGVPRFLIAPALNGVLAQRLLRRVCAHCRAVYRPAAAELRALLPEPIPGDIELVRAVGCAACDQTGYCGRLLVSELMVVSDEVRELISAEAPVSAMEAAARRGAYVPMYGQGLEAVFAGETTVAELARVLMNRSEASS